ncbi:ABC transporter ATP-binding protein [Dactylosporangium sp. NPDC051484]|uniref:ABC transporter ATP-binding protein n=1 Tax=Dactylosporangium sp. NPDC051484 TaxID=3154942 RepID=UPI00344C1425
MSRNDAPAQDRLLQVEGLDVHYGRRTHRTQVLWDTTFEVRRGESVGLIGETGSGKTTLARAIVGLVRPSAGRVVVDGKDVTAFTGRQWRALRRDGSVQYVFQDPLRSLDPELTIRATLREPLQLQRRLSADAIDERIAEQLELVRLEPELLDRYPSELSGGQRQRILLARALVTDPALLIMDEPVSALDAANRVLVLTLLNRLRDRGVSMLFISHDLGSVAGVTDRVLVLYRGELVETGSTADVVRRPRHPYARLLIGSAPTLTTGAVNRAERDELRRLLDGG